VGGEKTVGADMNFFNPYELINSTTQSHWKEKKKKNYKQYGGNY
jgi:hypothetical protein